MSADSGNEVPNDERLEWLLSLDDDQFKRMQKVARGPVYTRRQIAKYLGTGAVAALAGGASTGSAMAQQQASGDVGTSSNRVNVFELNNYSSSEEGGLQAAIDAASAGDRVIFDADETFSSDITAKSGVEIVGHQGATLTLADGSDANGIYIPAGASDLRIAGLRIDMNGQNQSSGGRGIVFDDAGSVSHIAIENNRIIDPNIDGIKLEADAAGETVTDVLISGNVVDNANVGGVGHGIICGALNDSTARVERLIITGNIINDYDAQGIGVFGASGGVARHITIANNHVTNDHATSAAIVYEGDGVTESVISNNTVVSNSGTPQNGILVDHGHHIVVDGNTVEGARSGMQLAQSSGEDVSDIVIANNNFKACKTYGLSLSEDSGSGYVGIFGNVFEIDGGNYGIDLRGHPSVVAIVNNEIRATANGGDFWGVNPGNGRAIISQNHVAGFDRQGIRVSGDDSTCVGNISVDNGQDGTDPYGIHLQAVDCTVIGNRCYDSGGGTQTHGIAGDGSSDYNAVVGNSLRGNATGATTNLGTNTITTGNVT